MVFRAAADATVGVHLAFVAYMVFGGFLNWRWPRLRPVHLGALAISAVIFATGSDCPLTDVQRALERAGSEIPFDDGFIERYIVRPVHPAGITPAIQWSIPFVVVLLQAAAYGTPYLRHRRRPTPRPRPA